MNDIESRLREFRPRRPAMIPDERLQLLRGPIWVAVATAMAAVMLIASWIERPVKPEVQPDTSLTLGQLTRLALENPEAFDTALARISRTSLPDVTQPGGVLQPLSKEF
jgi:hypothetical protein